MTAQLSGKHPNTDAVICTFHLSTQPNFTYVHMYVPYMDITYCKAKFIIHVPLLHVFYFT